MNPLIPGAIGFVLGALSLAATAVIFAGCIKPEPEPELIEPEDLLDAPKFGGLCECPGETGTAEKLPDIKLDSAGQVEQPTSESNASSAQIVNSISLGWKEPCSWCEKEQGLTPKPGDSHGICKRHKAQELAKLKNVSRSEFA